MGYPQYGARQVLDSKANEQGCWGLCRKKSNCYASLRRKRRSFADLPLEFWREFRRELDFALNGHQPWVKRSPLDGFFHLGTYRQQETRNLILLAKDSMGKLVVLLLSDLPRIVSDEFEVARLQYVLAGLLFKTLAFPTQSAA